MPTVSGQSSRLPFSLPPWVAAAPIPPDKHYLLLAMRWGVVLAVLAMSLTTSSTYIFRGTEGVALISNPWAIIPAVGGYNLLVSILIWWKQPLTQRQSGWLMLDDALQATLVIALTGGSGSLFFLLLLISVVEVGLSFYWPAALRLTAGSGILYMLAVILAPASSWDASAAPLAVAEFFVVLLVGALAALFGRQMRREDAARQQATLAVARASALNEISLRLGESGLELERILAAILDSVRFLPDTKFSLVLLSGAKSVDGHWQVAASNTARHPVGQQVAGDWEESGQQFSLAGAGCPHPLPAFVAGDGIDQLLKIRLTLLAGDAPGALVFGRQTDCPLSDDEQVFLRSLALEAEMALRNASLYAQEQEQVARLRRFEELQTTFFSTIAHELKTPLTVLKTLVPSLQQLPKLTLETQAEMTEIVEQNLARLESLIADLLESARLEANAVTPRRRPTNLASRAQRVINSLSPLLERKQRPVKLEVAPDLPLVWADGKRVEQILSNLVNNAAKFTPPGSAIKVELCPVDDAVQVCVADAGPGVPPGQRECIFDKFHTSVKDKALAGTGLGLFICRELVRLHQGHIWIEDRPGGGSRFCFTLPLAGKEKSKEKNNEKS